MARCFPWPYVPPPESEEMENKAHEDEVNVQQQQGDTTNEGLRIDKGKQLVPVASGVAAKDPNDDDNDPSKKRKRIIISNQEATIDDDDDARKQEVEKGITMVDSEKNPSSAKKPKIMLPIIIIEHCTDSPREDCNIIMDLKAHDLKENLERGIPGLVVKINPDSAIRNYNGLFRVRTQGGSRVYRDFGEKSNCYIDAVLLNPHKFVLEMKENVEKGLI